MNEFHPVQLCFLNTPRLYERFVARMKALDPLYHDARLTHLHFEVPPHPILNPTRLERRNHFWEAFCKPHPQTDRCAFIENLHEKVVHQQQRILKTGFPINNASTYLFIIGRLDDLDTLSVAHLLPKYISDNRWNIWGNMQIAYTSLGLFYLPNSASLTNKQRTALYAFWKETEALHQLNQLEIGFKKLILLSDSNTSEYHQRSYSELTETDLEDLVIEILLGLTSSPALLDKVTNKASEKSGLDDETMSIGTCTLALDSRFKQETLYADFTRTLLNSYAIADDKLIDKDFAHVKAKEFENTLFLEPEKIAQKLLHSDKDRENLLQQLRFNWHLLRPPNLNPFNLFTPEWLTAYLPTLQKLPTRLKQSAELLLSFGLMNFQHALSENQKALEAQLQANIAPITDDLMRNSNHHHISPAQTLYTLNALLQEVQSRAQEFRIKVADAEAFKTLSFLSTKDENELYTSREWLEISNDNTTTDKLEEHIKRLTTAIERFPLPLAFWSRYISLAFISGYLGHFLLSAIPTFLLNIGIQAVAGLPFIFVFTVVILFGFLRYHQVLSKIFHHRNAYIALVEKLARVEAKKYVLEAIEKCYQAVINKIQDEINDVRTLMENLKLASTQSFESTHKEETLFHRSIWGKLPIVQDIEKLSLHPLSEYDVPIMDKPPKLTIANTDCTLEMLNSHEELDVLKSLLNQFAKLSFANTNSTLQNIFDPNTKKPFHWWRKLLEPPPSDLLQVAILLEHEPENEWSRFIYLCKRFAQVAYQHIFNQDLEKMIGYISENRRKMIQQYFEMMSHPPVPRTDRNLELKDVFAIAQPASAQNSILLPPNSQESLPQPCTMIIGNAIQWFYWAHFSLKSLVWYQASQSTFKQLPKSEQDTMFLPEEILGITLNGSIDTVQASSNTSNESDSEPVLG